MRGDSAFHLDSERDERRVVINRIQDGCSLTLYSAIHVECVNVAKSYVPGHTDEMADPYVSSSCWVFDTSSRRQLGVLLHRLDLRILVRDFAIRPPNGVLRSNSAMMWPTDFGPVQGVVSALSNVVSLGIDCIYDPGRR